MRKGYFSSLVDIVLMNEWYYIQVCVRTELWVSFWVRYIVHYELFLRYRGSDEPITSDNHCPVVSGQPSLFVEMSDYCCQSTQPP